MMPIPEKSKKSLEQKHLPEIDKSIAAKNC